MTVQIFTVPTIARRLITEDNVLEKILKVLIDFCEKRYLKESPYNEEITRLVKKTILFFKDYFNSGFYR